MMIYLVVMLEVYFIWEALQRIRFLAAPHLVMIYCLLAQLVFYNAEALGYKEVAGPESLLSYQTNPNLGLTIYFVIALIAYTATIGFRISSRLLRSQLMMTLEHNDKFVRYAIWTVVGYTVLHFLLMDFDSLWYHRDYSTTGLRFDDAVSSVFGRLRPLVAMAAIVLMQLSLFSGKHSRFYLLLTVSVWQFLISFTGASRHAVVLIFASAGASLMFARRRHLLIGITHGVLGFLVLQAMIAGRGGTEFGLSAIPGLVGGMFDTDWRSATFALFNLFQGITVTVDGIVLSHEYDWSYALLSISPLPSSIDGFDAVLATSQFRLSVFVPMSSIAEAYLFGWAIFSVVVVVFFLSLRSTLSVAKAGYQIWALLSSIFLAAMFVMANAYPLRNTFRQFLLILVINMVIVALAGARASRRQAPARREISPLAARRF
ncbi:hypothetical protein [Bradyrhizobium ottawaense]|uniref:hypothetical protein n=1 Tax=Bradyrhizobium ottawaense TaxID=931866 RepID=UPI001BA71837|nr:hypothetical protein [Bradyrhizobium ottawaense]MBR1292467.1 hypothetical protein [Bradyrhizobium ottawaense]